MFLFAGVFACKKHGFASEDFTADSRVDDSPDADPPQDDSPENTASDDRPFGDRPSDDRLFGPSADLGDPQAPIFRFRTCSSKVPIARARIFPTSPSGTEWRSRERSSWSSAWTLWSAVKRTTYLPAPSASVVPVSRKTAGSDDADVAEDTASAEEVDALGVSGEVEQAVNTGR
jgi:hypothetical protein